MLLSRARDGLDGEDGDRGPEGPRGPRGFKGDIGPIGKRGPKGDNGRDGLNGKAGDKGPKGDKGDKGEKGDRGPQGPTGPAPEHEWQDTKLRFKKPDGDWGKAVDLKGPPGRNGAIVSLPGSGEAGDFQPLDADLTAIAELNTTPFGRSLLTVADAEAGRDLLEVGAGGASEWGDITGTLADQTDLQTELDAKQPLDSDLTAIAALTTTAFGRSFLDRANAAAGRTLLELGTAAQSATGDFDAAGSAAAAQAASQPLDADLTAIAALSTTAYGRALLELANQAALQSAVGITQYTDEMAQDAAGAMVSGNTEDGVTATYDDAANKINFANTDKGSTAVADHEAAGNPHPQYLTEAEADALYAPIGGGSYTDEEAQDAVGGILSDSGDIDFTYDDATPAITGAVKTDAIGNTKLANMAQATIKGRQAGAGTGDPEDLTATQARTALGLGTAALSNTGDFDSAGSAAAAQAASQPLDSDLTAIAALTTTSYGRGLLTLANQAALKSEVAAGFELISTNTLGGTAASVTFSSIPATYKALFLHVMSRTDTAGTTAEELRLRFNGDTGNNYDRQRMNGGAGTTTSEEALAQSNIFCGWSTSGGATANKFSGAQIVIPSYASTSFHKTVISTICAVWGTATGTLRTGTFSGVWRSTAAIDSVTLLPSSGNFAANSSFSLYGLK